ncbi:MAG: hypothetical protein J6W06_03605 [Bacteroidales bacterium]|nr:hypothetical protein [Bacteroidales bacterium]
MYNKQGDSDMKNYVTMVCAMIFAVVFFSSCNKNNDSIVGKWELQLAVKENISNANPSDIQIDTLSIEKTSSNLLQFQKNGKARFTGIDLIENKMIYNELYDWSISDDNKMLYLTNGISGEDNLEDKEIEILSLSGKQLVTKAKNVEVDFTYISTNTYKRK